jgi:hypothetical protein
MTKRELLTIVHAHTCIIRGNMYRFAVRDITTGELEEPAFACALLDVDAIGSYHSRPVAKLSVTAPLTHPASLPSLLTCALHACLHTSMFEGPNSDAPGNEVGGELSAIWNEQLRAS